jgi:hypothetical protein
VIALLVSACAPVSAPVRPIQSAAPAATDVDTLVRSALVALLPSPAFPRVDPLGVARVRVGNRYLIRSDLLPSTRQLTSGALPTIPEFEFSLISMDQALRTAHETGRVSFVAISDVQIDGDEATLWLGPDYVAAPDPNVIKLCCCRLRFRFVRTEGAWVFRERIGRTCD